MQNKIKKFLLCSFVFLSIAFISFNVSAFYGGYTNFQLKLWGTSEFGTYDNTLANGQKFNGSMTYSILTNRSDNAYDYIWCIEPGKPTSSSHLTNQGYSQYATYYAFSDLQNQVPYGDLELKRSLVARLLQIAQADADLSKWDVVGWDYHQRYGFTYKEYDTPVELGRVKYLSLQALIWESVLDERDWNFAWKGSRNNVPVYNQIRVPDKTNHYNFEKYYNIFADYMKQYGKVPSFTSKNANAPATIILNEWDGNGYYTTRTDSQGLLDDYVYHPNSNVSYSVNGQTMTIRSSNAYVNSTISGYNKNIKGRQDGSADLDAINTYKSRPQDQMVCGFDKHLDYVDFSFFNVQVANGTVRIDPNGGTWNGSSSVQTKSGKLKTSTTIATPSRTGYRFTGWTFQKNDSYSSLSGNSYTFGNGTSTLVANWTPNTFTLDLNGLLDGTNSGNIAGFGTCDVYINGSLTANDVTDFYQTYNYGTRYEFKDIKAANGKTYLGVSSGSLSGTLTSNTETRLSFKTNTYTLDLDCYLQGVYKENLNGIATCDVYINGSLVANDVSEYQKTHTHGTTYKITDIRVTGDNYKYVEGTDIVGTLTQNTTLTPHFIFYKTTLTVAPNGGIWRNSSVNQSFIGIYNDKMTIERPTRQYYTFKGWQHTGGGTFANDIFTYGETNATLTAQWMNHPPEIHGPIIKDAANIGNVSGVLPFIDDKNNIVIQQFDPFDPKNFFNATDYEEGDMLDRTQINNLVDPNVYGKTKFDCHVVDTPGLTADKTFNVIVNDKPLLDAPDRYFFVGELINQEVILEYATTSDHVGGTKKEDIKIKKVESTNNGAVNVDKIDTSKEDVLKITYTVTDPYRRTTEHIAYFTISKTQQDFDIKTIRYISKDYLHTLDPNASWKKNPNLYQELVTSLNKVANDNEALYVIEMNEEQANQIKDMIINSPQDQELNKSILNKFSHLFKKRPADGSGKTLQ